MVIIIYSFVLGYSLMKERKKERKEEKKVKEKKERQTKRNIVFSYRTCTLMLSKYVSISTEVVSFFFLTDLRFSR